MEVSFSFQCRYDDSEDYYTDDPFANIVFVYPKYPMGQTKLSWIRSFINKAKDALFSDEYSSLEKGYHNYIDIASFVDYFLVGVLHLDDFMSKKLTFPIFTHIMQIVETTVNHDAYRYSTFMQYDSLLEKMKAGPHWDYGLSFGNCDFNFYGHGRVRLYIWSFCVRD